VSAWQLTSLTIMSSWYQVSVKNYCGWVLLGVTYAGLSVRGSVSLSVGPSRKMARFTLSADDRPQYCSSAGGWGGYVCEAQNIRCCYWKTFLKCAKRHYVSVVSWGMLEMWAIRLYKVAPLFGPPATLQQRCEAPWSPFSFLGVMCATCGMECVCVARHLASVAVRRLASTARTTLHS